MGAIEDFENALYDFNKAIKAASEAGGIKLNVECYDDFGHDLKHPVVRGWITVPIGGKDVC